MILGLEHPVPLTSKANLASTYRNQGPIARDIFYFSFKSTSIAASGGRHSPAGGRQAVRRATVRTNHPHSKPCPARDRTRKPPAPTPCLARVRPRNAPAAIRCSFAQPAPQAVPSRRQHPENNPYSRPCPSTRPHSQTAPRAHARNPLGRLCPARARFRRPPAAITRPCAESTR